MHLYEKQLTKKRATTSDASHWLPLECQDPLTCDALRSVKIMCFPELVFASGQDVFFCRVFSSLDAEETLLSVNAQDLDAFDAASRGGRKP